MMAVRAQLARISDVTTVQRQFLREKIKFPALAMGGTTIQAGAPRLREAAQSV
jgi:hypothetical protein